MDRMAKQLTDVLLKLKKVTQESISVAEFAQIVEIDESRSVGKYKCELLCNTNLSVRCECLKDIELDVGTRVLIIFCDSDFRSVLQKIRNDMSTQIPYSNELHSVSYGCIIGKI